MGKKQRSKDTQLRCYPLVSVCTPTFNRRPFIPAIIECFNSQTYPKEKIEWIIIDDGTDKVGHLFSSIPQVKYFSYDEKMVLGKKRNLMHEKSTGDIIVYMDDDDYYPPERIEHAVRKLQSNPRILCGGSSELHIYFNSLNKLVQFGPYAPNHATAGTFAFKRKLLDQTRYDDDAALAEEKAFLQNYTIPFIQFDTKKTILVFSHRHNTFDKSRLLENPNKFIKDSRLNVSDFIKDQKVSSFYMTKVDELLANYELGESKYKPDVMEQTKQIEEMRKKKQEEYENSKKQLFKIKLDDGSEKNATIDEISQMLSDLRIENNHLKSYIISLKNELSRYKA
jgi:glycosyltransferase involved in cell wall biosynthesis